MTHQGHAYLSLMACHADMQPESFVQGKWFNENTMIIRLPAADVSTCRSKGPDGVKGERMYDHMLTCRVIKTKNW